MSDLSKLSPDLRTKARDLRWKGEAMAGFTTMKEIGEEDGAGAGDAERRRTSLARNRKGKLRA
jgi:hypothetical protein